VKSPKKKDPSMAKFETAISTIGLQGLGLRVNGYRRLQGVLQSIGIRPKIVVKSEEQRKKARRIII